MVKIEDIIKSNKKARQTTKSWKEAYANRSPSPGKPTKYLSRYNAMIYEMATRGYTKKTMAKMLDIKRDTLDVWLARNPKFKERYEEGRKHLIEELEGKMLDNAMGRCRHVERTLDSDGNILSEIIRETEGPADQKALERYLAVKAKAEWGKEEQQAPANQTINQIINQIQLAPGKADELFHSMLAAPIIEGLAKQIKGPNG